MTQNETVSSAFSALQEFGEAKSPRRVVFAQPDQDPVLEAALGLGRRGLIVPVLLGDTLLLGSRAATLGLNVAGAEILGVLSHGTYRDGWRAELASRGVRAVEADRSLSVPSTLARAMVKAGDAAAAVYGPIPEEFGDDPPEGARRANRCLTLVGGPRAGLALVASPVEGSVPSVMALVESALAIADIGQRLSGLAPEIVFLAPGVPVSFDRRVQFRSAKEELRLRVLKAIETVRARIGGAGVARGLHFNIPELAESAPARLRGFVLTQPQDSAAIRRVLDAAWSAGPVYQGPDGIWGELSGADSVDEVGLISLLAALSAEIDDASAGARGS